MQQNTRAHTNKLKRREGEEDERRGKRMRRGGRGGGRGGRGGMMEDGGGTEVEVLLKRDQTVFSIFAKTIKAG